MLNLDIGIHENIPFAVYNEIDAIRSSQLKMLLDGPPADLKYALDNPEKKEKDALIEGELVHCWLFEPEMIEQRFLFEATLLKDKSKLEENGGSKRAWDELKAKAKDLGLQIIPYDIYIRSLAIAEQVRAHPRWSNIESFARKELTLIAEINDVLCKVRFDALLYGNTMGGIVFDLKTMRDKATLRNIDSAITDYSYHFSAAMYLEVGKALGLDLRGFSWIWAEKQPPYNVRITSASESMLQRGKYEFYHCLELFKTCCTTGVWSGYPDDIEERELPGWYEYRSYPFGELKTL
jgi:PDDEXK-like domain of unknown function (DUF3799)